MARISEYSSRVEGRGRGRSGLGAAALRCVKLLDMPAVVSESQPSALTSLTEEEKLFQASVRRFAREQIAPHVREMDEAAVFRADLIRQFFDLGLMGIEIPEQYGGQGGSFFQCVLAVAELSA